MPIVSTARMTARQFLMLGEDPPGVRLELVNGEVAVSPSATPDHGFVISRLMWILNNHVIPNDLGDVYSDIDTILDPYNVRRPDILFFAKNRKHLVGNNAMEGPPDLAVEVLSPSSVEIDRQDKFDQYREAGVNHYWIVDIDARSIEAWQLRANQFIPCGGGKNDDVVRLPPFEGVEIPLERLGRK